MLDMLMLLQQCAPDVAPTTMHRIISVESAWRPHVIGYKLTKDKKVYTLTQQPKDKEQAIAWATWFFENGYRFDAGIAQINSQHFKRYGITPELAFDPCTNIKLGGKILTDFYKSAAKKYGEGQEALLAAVSAYNSGNFKTGFTNGYVTKFTRQSLSTMKDHQTSHLPIVQATSETPLSKRDDFTQKPIILNKRFTQEETNPYTVSSTVAVFSHFSPNRK